MPYDLPPDAFPSESENDDAPESISLSQSRKSVQKLEAERRNAEVAQRQAKKKKNREMDRKLKERSLINKRERGSVDEIRVEVEKKKRRKANGEGQESDELEKRMQRAMQEAELESDGAEFMGINRIDKTEENADDDIDPASSRGASGMNVGHLPDELFAAAFSSSLKRKTTEDDTTPAPPKKKRKSSKKNNIVIGFVYQSGSSNLLTPICSRSRAIRILPNSSNPPIPSTSPSQKVTKFLNRTLGLKNGKQNLRSKGWERRPGNIYQLRGYPFS